MRRTVLNYKYRGCHLCAVISFLASLLLLLPTLSEIVTAQAPPITPSGGLNTEVSAPLPAAGGKIQYDITGGTRPGGGVNLFHSFGDFNVPNNNIANFLNDSGLATSNILGRVTGGNPSTIFGTIQTTGFGNANLFLMNPTGFLFGQNATVNVGGMVAFTTADYLRLANGTLFNAIPNATADALLSAAPVAAFGFLGSNPGAITVQGSQLSVTPGQSISLVGGNISVQSGLLDDGTTVQPARLSAPGGQINLASVASPGEILTGTLAQSPNINGQSFGNLGTIQVTEQSLIDVSGNGGGTVLIRGGQFLLDNSTISANVTGPGPVTNGLESIGGGIDIQVKQDAVIQNLAVIETQIAGNATPGVQYGGVNITAGHIEIAGVLDYELFPFTGIKSDVLPGSTGGHSGNVELKANSILGKDLGQIETLTGGAGNAGDIKLTAIHDIDLNSVLIQSSSVDAAGNAGNIGLMSTSGNISMTAFTTVTSQATFSNGQAGTIRLSAPIGNILLDQAFVFNQSFNAGPIGGIELTAKNLELNGGSEINGDNLTTLTPGNISVTLSDSLSLDGDSGIQTVARGSATAADLTIRAHDVSIAGNSFLSTETLVSGSGGRLSISTENLQLKDGGQLKSGSTIGMDESGPTIPSGAGGTITIQGLSGSAQSVLIDGADSGIVTNAEGTGAGGDIFVNANSVTLQNGGTLSAKTSGTAPTATGGTITVEGNRVQLNSAATITTVTSGPANAGEVLVRSDTFSINEGATISAQSTGSGNAGNVTIQGLVNPAQSVLIDGPGSGVFTDTKGPGAGGNIRIDASQFALSNRATLSAQTAGSGKAGNTTVMASSFSISEGALIFAGTAKGTTGHGGNISVQADEVLLTDNAGMSTSTLGKGDAGAIAITAQDRISLTDSRMNSSTFAFRGEPEGGQGGQITLHAPTIDISNGEIVSSSQSSGNAGNVLLETARLTLDASRLEASASGSGNAGDITIRGLTAAGSSSGQVALMGASQVLSETSNNGNGGTIAIQTGQLMMQDNSLISTSSLGEGIEGDAGNVTLNASQSLRVTSGSLIESGSLALSEGNAGNITVTAPAITLDGGTISTTTEFAGSAGTVMIETNSLTVQNGGQIASSSVIVDDIPAGPAGNITIQGLASPAQAVLIDGVGSGISTDTQGTGAGGNILVNANSVTLQNGGTLSAKTSGPTDTSAGGTIAVVATDTMAMTSHASISASSSGTADAGNIDITAMNGFTMQNSTITTEAGQGAGGGNIKVTTSPAATVLLQDTSLISASVADGRGGGGNISIDPQFVILQNSQILARAAEGQGGRITITTNLFLQDANSNVNADSGRGVNGTVTIQSPNAPISGQIQPLGKTPLLATTLLNQHCASLAGGEFSSFTVAGRDSLPAEPGGWLFSPLATLDAGMGLGAKAEGVRPVARGDGLEGDAPILSLRQIAPAGFLTQAFAVDQTGCTS